MPRATILRSRSRGRALECRSNDTCRAGDAARTARVQKERHLKGCSKWITWALRSSVPSSLSYQASMATLKTARVGYRIDCKRCIHEFRPTANHGLDASLSGGNIYRPEGRHHPQIDARKRRRHGGRQAAGDITG